MGSTARCTVRRRCAFTLTEVLLAVAVIAVLLAILMPALARARATARMVRELAAAKQNTATYINYAGDFKDAVVPALPAWDTIRSGCPAPPRHRLRAPDPFNPGSNIDGALCKNWFYYLQGWAGTPLAAWQIDKPAYDNFWNRPRTASSNFGWTDYDQLAAASAFGYHPTLGLNGVFMGGSFQHGGLRGQWGLTNPSLGHFYLTRLSQARDPARLTVFASARGGDVASSTSFWNWGAAYPNYGRNQPGYFLVTPAFPAYGSTSISNTTPWTYADRYNEALAPGSWGNVSFRHLGMACVSAVDGHASTMTVGEMRDMRIWSNYADRPNWTFQHGP